MNPAAADVEAVVVGRDDSVPGVVVLELEAAPGRTLPSWTPGAHVDVLQPGGAVRQYSLSGTPGSDRWRLGVLREPEGRGGSVWLCDRVEVGGRLRLAGPRSHFAFAPPPGAPVLLIAGGIGITPLVPMAAAAAAAGRDYVLHYAGRAGRMAFLPELAALHGDRLVVHDGVQRGRLDVDALLAAASPGTVVHCCGPARLMDAVEAAGAAAGLEVVVERFTAAELHEPVLQEAFEVELEQSGFSVTVPPGRSILEVVEEAGVFVLSSCHEGTCGTCETPVLEGAIDHRDSILTPVERARGDLMYVCVSRAACPRIVLDL